MSYDNLDGLTRLLEQCQAGELSAADTAVIKSAVKSVRDSDALISLVKIGFECEPFVEATADLLEADLPNWSVAALTRVIEALLFQGLDQRAAPLADELLRRSPGESYHIRLWAFSASAPEAVMRRFAAALPGAANRTAVILDAREFAARNKKADLVSIIEDAIEALDGG